MQGFCRLVLGDSCGIEFTYSVVTGGNKNPKKRKYASMAEDQNLPEEIRDILSSGMDPTSDVPLVAVSHEYSSEKQVKKIQVSTIVCFLGAPLTLVFSSTPRNSRLN